MRIIVKESQYNKLLTQQNKTNYFIQEWASYIGDILSTHIHKFNVKEDVNTHTSLNKKLGNKSFYKKLPIDNFIFTLVENKEIENVKIDFSPYWGHLTEGIIKDVELVIQLPTRHLNGLNEKEEITNKLLKEFIKIKDWSTVSSLLNEQYKVIPYTKENGVDLATNHMLDDAAALNSFVNLWLGKNIHITDVNGEILTIKDDFTLEEKEDLKRGSETDKDVHIDFGDNMRMSVTDDSIADDFTIRKLKFYKDLKSKGVPFQIFDDVLGNTLTADLGEQPFFPTRDEIPPAGIHYFPKISLDNTLYPIAFVQGLPSDIEVDEKIDRDQAHTIFGYDPRGDWKTLAHYLKPLEIKPEETLPDGYVKIDDPLLYTPSLSSKYGMRIHPIKRKKRMHWGNDYSVPQGSPLVILKKGIVRDAKIRNNACGGTLKIKMVDGNSIRFCHLSNLKVKKGDPISPGQIVALTGGGKHSVGAGGSTGPHLHFEFKKDNKGNPIDPTNYAKTYWVIKK